MSPEALSEKELAQYRLSVAGYDDDIDDLSAAMIRRLLVTVDLLKVKIARLEAVVERLRARAGA